MEEFEISAYENVSIYKETMRRQHDLRIFQWEFKMSDPLLLYISKLRLFLGKLTLKQSGPFKVSSVMDNGVMELENSKGGKVFVNGKLLKIYFEKSLSVSSDESFVYA